MSKPTRDRKGRFTGSLGPGRIAPAPVAGIRPAAHPASSSRGANETNDANGSVVDTVSAAHAAMRATQHDRSSVVSWCVANLRERLNGPGTVRVLFRFPRGTNQADITARLERAGQRTQGPQDTGPQEPDTWAVARDDVTGIVTATGPLVDNDDAGWEQMSAVEKTLRGPWWSRREIHNVEAQADRTG